TEQEKNLGAVLIDIGHGTTDIAMYVEGSVWHTKVLPVGGWQLTNDLVIVFNIPYEAAEALKLQYGQAVAPGAPPHSQSKPEQPVNGKSHPAGAQAYAEYASATELRVQGSRVKTQEPNFEPGAEILEAHTFEGGTRLISRG